MGGGQHIELDTTEQRGKRKPLRRHRSSSPQREPPLLYITHYVTIENTTTSKAQKERCQTHHDET